MACLTTFFFFPNRCSDPLSELNLSDNQSFNTWHKISVISKGLTEKQTRNYLQQLQELNTSGKVMKVKKKFLPLANTFIWGFATMSVSGDKLRSLPVIKLCMCLTARHADCGIKPIRRCFCPSSHKPWRQHFSRWWCLCPTGGIHHTVIIPVWFISYSSGNSSNVNFQISVNKLLSFSLSWQICFTSLDN